MSSVQTQGTSYTLNIMECSDLEYHRTIGFWGKSSWDNNAAGLTQKNGKYEILIMLLFLWKKNKNI